MKRSSEIYRDGLHYDMMNNFDHDIDFYNQIIKSSSGNLLELGCGTGRIALNISKKNGEIYCLDNNAQMLNHAKEKSKVNDIEIKWILGDMSDFKFDITFSIIIIAFDSFCHLHNFKKISNCLTNIYNHLDKEGQFILDINNPDLKFLLRTDGDITTRAKYKDPYGTEDVIVSQSSSYNKSSQIHTINWRFEIGKIVKEQQLLKKVFFPDEIINYLLFSNFEIVGQFGWFDRSPFQSNSRRNIIVCKKNL